MQASDETSLLKCGRYASRAINVRILGSYSAPTERGRGRGGKGERSVHEGGYLTRNYILEEAGNDQGGVGPMQTNVPSVFKNMSLPDDLHNSNPLTC